MARGGSQHIPRPAQWSMGGPPVWHRRDLGALSDFAALTDALVHQVADREPADWVPPYLPADDRRVSAVLVALHDSPDGPSVVLTRRTSILSTHRGEMAFPGGRVEEGETLVDAAVREAHEEVGLDPSLVTPWGMLDTLSTMVSSSRIHPVVATLPGTPDLVAHDREVERIVHVPLAELASEDTYRRETWVRGRHTVDMHFFEIEGDTVWGATGRMLHQLLDLLTAPRTA
ncbi:MAG: NUDIX hydrolase [Acidimicrobiales bacterium]